MHAYFKEITSCVGDIMLCEIEENNDHDKCAVAVKNQAMHTVGHVPIELSKLFNKFVGDGDEVEAECIGKRYNAGQGKGLEIPVDYRLVGSRQYLVRFVSRLSKKEFVGNFNVSDIRKCQS
jgi:hypothetical protein